MCHGEEDVIYAAHAVKGAIQVLELQTGHVPFIGPTRIIQSGMKQYYSLHYVPSPNGLVIISGKSARIIRAMSAETGEKVWEVTGKIDGEMCEPHSLLFSTQHQILFVADGSNCRVLVLHPRDGSHLQIIQLNKDMGSICELCLYQNKLIVDHYNGWIEKVSYFSIN